MIKNNEDEYLVKAEQERKYKEEIKRDIQVSKSIVQDEVTLKMFAQPLSRKDVDKISIDKSNNLDIVHVTGLSPKAAAQRVLNYVASKSNVTDVLVVDSEEALKEASKDYMFVDDIKENIILKPTNNAFGFGEMPSKIHVMVPRTHLYGYDSTKALPNDDESYEDLTYIKIESLPAEIADFLNKYVVLSVTSNALDLEILEKSAHKLLESIKSIKKRRNEQ